MPPRAVIFDLDGTLLDTLDDLTASLNRALAERCLPPHPARRVRRMIGDGARALIRRAIATRDATDERVDAVLRAFRRDYGLRWDQRTRPYPGVPALLDGLVDRGLPLAILSNKPHEFTVDMVARLLGRWKFAEVVGAGEAFPLKPDPAAARHITATLGVPPEECLLVGDSMVDVQTAHAAGMIPVAVCWGFRDEDELRQADPAHVIQAPAELLTVLPGTPCAPVR